MSTKSNCVLCSVLFTLSSFGVTSAQAQTSEISQSPLYLGGGNVPGNLALALSVEYPTVVSIANPGDGNSLSATPKYLPATTYIGYFDSKKCYSYSYNSDEKLRHFYPSGAATNHVCSGKWSGNFLNWATMQTIDPFRLVLTGGYRIKDTPTEKDTSTETWLEKAWASGQGGTANFPNLRLPSSGDDKSMVQGATPFSNINFVGMGIQGFGNKMRFALNGDVTISPCNKDEKPPLPAKCTNYITPVTAYDPSVAVSTTSPYEVSIRVKVCDSSASAGGVEANCKQYSEGWKPEGLMQQYADGIRFSVFGYLNDSNILRDGGVLRAAQKYIGPKKLEPGSGVIDNPNCEWNTLTFAYFL